jgi:hypothetical protein
VDKTSQKLDVDNAEDDAQNQLYVHGRILIENGPIFCQMTARHSPSHHAHRPHANEHGIVSAGLILPGFPIADKWARPCVVTFDTLSRLTHQHWRLLLSSAQPDAGENQAANSIVAIRQIVRDNRMTLPFADKQMMLRLVFLQRYDDLRTRQRLDFRRVRDELAKAIEAHDVRVSSETRDLLLDLGRAEDELSAEISQYPEIHNDRLHESNCAVSTCTTRFILDTCARSYV